MNCRSNPKLTLDRKSTGVSAENSMRNGQTDSRAIRFGRIERLANPHESFFRNPDASIPGRHATRALVNRAFDDCPAARAQRLTGVYKYVRENLLQRYGITVDRKFRGAASPYDGPAVLDERWFCRSDGRIDHVS